MNNIPRTRIQDLKEAFASIVSMMLGLLRAHGVRGLVHLPEVWLATREIKRIAEAFTELFAAWSAGRLDATPAPATSPQAGQAAHPQPAATPRVAARRVAPRHRRPHAQPAPAKPARARFAHAGSTRVPAPRPHPCALPAGILVTGRST
jgi:hypothetical protein